MYTSRNTVSLRISTTVCIFLGTPQVCKGRLIDRGHLQLQYYYSLVHVYIYEWWMVGKLSQSNYQKPSAFKSHIRRAAAQRPSGSSFYWRSLFHSKQQLTSLQYLKLSRRLQGAGLIAGGYQQAKQIAPEEIPPLAV